MSKLLNAKILIGLWLAAFLAPASYGACTYTVSPAMHSRGYGTATNTFTVWAGLGCAWTVSNPVSWLSIQSGASGTSTGTVTYVVEANPSLNGRTGAVTVAGVSFTVEQDGVPCNYSISPASRSHGYSMTNNAFAVGAGTGCVWSVSNPVSWITIQSGASGTGNSNVTYQISANVDSVGRTGVVTIAGVSFTVWQDGVPCNYSISPGGRNHGKGGSPATNRVSISAAVNCAWTVINTNPWINFIGATNGVGNGSVIYGVQTNNALPISRTGNVWIAEQLFVLSQNAGSCNYEVIPASRSHGHTGSSGTNRVDTIPINGGCTWYVVNTNDWITMAANSTGTNSGKTFVYTVAPNPNSWPRDGALTVWGEPFFVYQQPAPCSNGYSILPSSSEPGAEPETNTVQVTAVGGCPWAVVNTNNWITILSPTNNTNSGSVTWAVAYNTSTIGRTGVVVIAQKNFTVRQDAAICTYRLSPASRKHGYNAVTDTVSIDTLSICPWNVVNTNSWITFYAPTNGVGDSTNITYSILANPAGSSRTGLVFIGGQSLVLTQLGVSCAIDLSPMNHDHGHGWATNKFDVNIAANCNWVVNNTNTWIQITTNSSGTGTNKFGYIVSPNPNSTSRTGYIYVEEGTVSIVQAGAPCKVPLTPTSATRSPLQETGTVVVASPGGCNWSAATTNPWVTILSGTTGTGINVVTYRVDPNANGGARSGGITVTGQADTNYFSIDQDGVTCAYSLSPTNRSHGPGAVLDAKFKVLVSNACPWMVENPNSWINITTNSSGSGSNEVSYSVEANSLTPFQRIGALVVQGQTLVITQRGITCAYSLSPKTVTHGYGATSDSFNVTTTNGCAWSVSSANPWVTITTNASGTASATISYAVEANSGLAERIAVLTLDGQTFTITQRAATCSFSVSPKTVTHGYGMASDSFNVLTTNGCEWSVGNTNTWVAITTNASGTASATVAYTVQENPNLAERIAILTVDAQTFTITQRAATCSISLSATNRSHGYAAKTNSVFVDTAAGCTWAVSTPNSWILILSTNLGTGTGTVSYAVQLNTNLTGRVGSIQIGTRTLVINQSPFDCNYKLSATSRSHGFGANSNSINVTNVGPSCTWSVNTTTDWITITSASSGTGNGTVSYAFSPNYGTTSRTGAVTVAEETLTITQLASTDGFSFESVIPGPSGEVVLKLNGGPPGIWGIYSSPDLITWTRFANITNTTGRVEFIVPSTGGTNCFYRAALQ